jgi:hypothetical protein
MEIVIFFAFIGVCAFALVWASRKTKSEAELARQNRMARNEERTDKLVSPRDNLLAHGDQVWQSRRQHANSGVEEINPFVLKSEATDGPEYDGYSRRNRHHVRERTAQIKEDTPAEEFTMTAVEFDQEEKKGPEKAAG